MAASPTIQPARPAARPAVKPAAKPAAAGPAVPAALPAYLRAPSVAKAAAPVVAPLSTTGQPIDAAVRTTLEARFQRDLSGVRVHPNAGDKISATVPGARAVTIGDD